MHVFRFNTGLKNAFFAALLHVLCTTTFYRIQNEFENAELYDLHIVIGHFAHIESSMRADRFVNRFIARLLDIVQAVIEI